MRRFEVLSPAGDVNNFYEAIRSGADAVYMGLDKFNARMKAENIGINDLDELIRFAHLKGVKVYITLNTLLSDSEIREAIAMVGDCLKAGVDAFIVQDYGLIGVLKAVYPNIVLHGSTQLGVHNRYGAIVAKSLGLSRVVLSREVALEDIKDISENVDIELEVFVQGAMCVCFSGNCYLSSLKHGASGNRGECKQLCRLSYTMISSTSKIKGYTISPRDNCMLPYLKELCEIGVVSFKIEGRLRRKGYVGVSTRIYRQAVDIIESELGIDVNNLEDGLVANERYVNLGTLNKFNLEDSKMSLKKVFSRGEFISGYFNGNDIIDINNNNHIGEKIGSVVRCEKFKDIYKITMELNAEIHSGDGLKFKFDNEIESLGVGNIEKHDNKHMVYGKNHIKPNSEVYRVLDVQFENTGEDISRSRQLNINIEARVGNPIVVKCRCGNKEICVSGAECVEAKSRPITEQNIIEQFSKGIDGYVLNFDSVVLEGNVFLPLSELNSLRREMLGKIEKEILSEYVLSYEKRSVPSNIVLEEPTYNALAIVDEDTNIRTISGYEGVILSPKNYSRRVIEDFERKYSSVFATPLIINLPIIAMKEDLVIVDEIVDFAKERNLILMANNIYGLYYITKVLFLLYTEKFHLLLSVGNFPK